MNKGNCNGAGEGGGGTKKVPLPIPISQKSGSKKEMQGLILDRYETGKLLGHGTFAKVYLARNVKTNESVAIKVIDKEKILKVGLIGHIKREISILRRVRHPNIVQLFEVMATKSKIYFVMEYVKGGELFGKVAKGRLKEDVARKYFQQLISAVSFCHARGVYHRDLKPENILLDEDGNLKVSDFGLSAISDQIKQDGLFHTFCGTPAYVAPEVLARKGYDAAKVDIWSCGVILYVLIAGYLPFHDRNVMAMYKKIYRGEFRCPKWFHGDLVKFFTHLLDINPQTRMTIPEIMGHKWFRKGFKQVKFYIEDDRLCSISDEVDNAMDTCSEQSFSESGSEKDSETKFSSLHRPASLNAFDIISFSSGFDLSGFFEEGGEGTRFVSGATVLGIISKLEELARVVSFTSRKKNCKISLEGPREGAKGPLTVLAEIFELTPSLRLVEVRKKAGDRSEYEEFYNSELKPVLQNLATEGVSETQDYAEFYNSEVKPGLQNLAIEDASDRPELSEFYNYGLKPGLLNLTVESPSVTTHLPSDTDRPECTEETSKSIQVHDPYVPKPGLPNVTMESDSVMTHLDSDTGRLESAEETSKSTQVHEPYVPKSIPRQQRDTQAADAVPDNLQEHINDLNEMIRNIQPAFQKEDAMPIVLSSTPECREVEMPKEFNKFYNCGPKPGLQTVTMEGPSVMAHLASDTDWPVSAEETSKSIQLHEPNFPKSIPRQQRDTKAADGVNDLKETIQNIQPAYQKEDTMPIALPFTPVHHEVQVAKEFYETYNYGLKPGFQNVTKEGPSVKTHLASDTK